MQNFTNSEDGPIVTVRIRVDHQPKSVPGNSTLTLPGNTSKLNTNQSFLLELAVHHSLLNVPVVNYHCVTQKVSVILMNMTDHNVWIK